MYGCTLIIQRITRRSFWQVKQRSKTWPRSYLRMTMTDEKLDWMNWLMRSRPVVPRSSLSRLSLPWSTPLQDSMNLTHLNLYPEWHTWGKGNQRTTRNRSCWQQAPGGWRERKGEPKDQDESRWSDSTSKILRLRYHQDRNPIERSERRDWSIESIEWNSPLPSHSA